LGFGIWFNYEGLRVEDLQLRVEVLECSAAGYVKGERSRAKGLGCRVKGFNTF